VNKHARRKKERACCEGIIIATLGGHKKEGAMYTKVSQTILPKKLRKPMKKKKNKTRLFIQKLASPFDFHSFQAPPKFTEGN
jgi:hypothetical protein